MKHGSWVLAAGAIACLAAAYLAAAPFARDQMLQFARAWQERNDGADLAHQLVSRDSLLDYMAVHPEQVALAAWEIGDESEGIAVHAQRSQPVVNASSLVLLAAYADASASAAEAGQLVPLSSWQRYFLPGTDGGVHQAAVHAARADGALLDDVEGDAGGSVIFGEQARSGRLSVDDVVRAMVRYGDPVAADLLMDRLGRARLTEYVQRLGFANDAVPLPFAGMQLSFLVDAPGPEILARYRVMKRSAYADTTWALFARLRDDPAFHASVSARLERDGVVLSLRERAELIEALSPRGTARTYARLMEQIVSGQRAGGQYLRQPLQWPLQGQRTRNEFDVFGTLTGSQPGVYASVTYARVKGARKTKVLALMLHKLPLGVWLRLSSSLVLPRFEAELLGDDAFFARVKQRLASDAVTSAETTAAELRRVHPLTR